MEEEKLLFTIENANILSERKDSKFALLSIDFFASGMNRHDTYVSEETLLKTADSIKNCPLVWKFDKYTMDAEGHSPLEVPCGFVPESSEIKTKKMEDGRTMLSVTAYIWKNYTGPLLDFFKRDGGKKPVSVEMIVKGIKKIKDNIVQILDYEYQAITILGTNIRPAIPLAQANVLSFSDIAKTYLEEIEDLSIDMRIPDEIKENAKKAISMKKEKSSFGTSIDLAFAHYLIKNEEISLEQLEHGYKNLSEDKITGDELLFWGGPTSKDWLTSLAFSIKESKNKNNFSEMEKNLMKKTLPDGTVIDVEENFADDTNPEDAEKNPGVENKKFEYPMEMAKMTEMFSDDEDSEARDEFSKEEPDPFKVMSLMYAKMCKMSALNTQIQETNKAFMAENAELKKFKEDVESSRMKFAVNKTIADLSAVVEIPEEVKEEMIAKSSDYSMDNLQEWEVYCKARSFEFAVKEDKKKDDVTRIGLPNQNKGNKKPTSNGNIW